MSLFSDKPNSEELADPKNQRCERDNYDPIIYAKGNHIEKTSSERHYQYLAEQDDGGYFHKSLASLEMKCRASGLEGPCVEHIPELEEYEDREEQG